MLPFRFLCNNSFFFHVLPKKGNTGWKSQVIVSFPFSSNQQTFNSTKIQLSKKKYEVRHTKVEFRMGKVPLMARGLFLESPKNFMGLNSQLSNCNLYVLKS